MSIYVIAPTLGWTLPSLIPIVAAIATTYGYKKVTARDDKAWLKGKLTREMENLRRVRVNVDQIVSDVVSDEVGRDERLVFEREKDRRLVFARDAHGKFYVEILGPRILPAHQLEEEARAFIRELVQEFAYNRVMQELEARGINVVQEQTEEESGDIVLDLRRW